MVLPKKLIAAMMFCFGLVVMGASPAAAYEVNITISGLEGLDLAGFEFVVNYDSSLTVTDYTPTEELGSFTGPDPDYPDAEDWSEWEDETGTAYHLSVLSYLSDFSTQADSFVLATISFSGDESALSGITLSSIILSDVDGNGIAFTVNGTHISAVPVPGAFCLMGSGMLALSFLRRKKN